MLSKSGANVNATDASGNTPLHETVGLANQRQIIIRKLISLTAIGRTANRAMESINDNETLKRKNKFYLELINQLLIQGCDIDQQDKEGKTALHLAVTMNNENALLGLLNNGADMDVTDESGKTTFAYCCELEWPANDFVCEEYWINSIGRDYANRKFAAIFVSHVYKLEFCKLPVNEQNKLLQVTMSKALERTMDGEVLELFHDEMDKLKSVKIGNMSLSLYEFLTNEKVEMVCANMTHQERQDVEQFCDNIAKRNFSEINCLVKLKYRKSVERKCLLEPAATALNILAHYQLPELVSRYIFTFLRNGDLKRMVASVK